LKISPQAALKVTLKLSFAEIHHSLDHQESRAALTRFPSEMWAYIVVAVIWVVLLIPVVNERLAWMAYSHIGKSAFFTSMLLSLGLHRTGDISDILWLEIIGFVVFVPAAILIASSIIASTRGGMANTGILGIIGNPMYLGIAIGAFALILVFQSILSIVLSTIAVLLLWMASKVQDKYNIKYMTSVPRWNAFKGLRKRYAGSITQQGTKGLAPSCERIKRAVCKFYDIGQAELLHSRRGCSTSRGMWQSI
jgi:protein-S-isoprenylcysteine O-methyltransferase Ste14